MKNSKCNKITAEWAVLLLIYHVVADILFAFTKAVYELFSSNNIGCDIL